MFIPASISSRRRPASSSGEVTPSQPIISGAVSGRDAAGGQPSGHGSTVKDGHWLRHLAVLAW